MGIVHVRADRLPSMRLGEAATTFLDTISVPSTRRGCAAALNRLVLDFGADTEVGALDPDRVAAWFTAVWGTRSTKTFSTRLTALGSACSYWRAQVRLVGDPLVRLRTRPAPPDRHRRAEPGAGRTDRPYDRAPARASALDPAV